MLIEREIGSFRSERRHHSCNNRRVKSLEVPEADEVVQLGPRLHLTQHRLCRAIAGERGEKSFLRLVGDTK